MRPNPETSPAVEQAESKSAAARRVRAVGGVALFIFLNLFASVCFKQCAADPKHTWHYFIAGNLFGPVSVVFLMMAYANMNPNLVSALAMGVGGACVQITFWLVYAAALTPWQWTGIALAIVGGVIAVSGKPAAKAPDAGNPDGTEGERP